METTTILLLVFLFFLFVIAAVAFGLSVYSASRPAGTNKTEEVIISASSMGEFVFTRAHDACVSIFALLDDLSTLRLGSGFITEVDSQSRLVIVTAAHVAMDAAEYNIVVSDVEGSNLQINVELVGIDKAADIAILRSILGEHSFNSVTQKVIDFIEDDDASSHQTGQLAFSIGNPLGQDFSSISEGVVRDWKYVPTTNSGSVESIYTSVPTTNGNSGGPFLLVTGQCAGLSNWIATNDSQPLNNFSGGLNAYMARRIVPRLIAGNNNRGYLGLSDLQVVAGAALLTLRTAFPAFALSGFDTPNGVMIVGLDTENINIANSRCSNAGLQVNDILLSISGVKLGVFDDEFSPTRVSWFTNPGTTVAVVAVRPSTASVLNVDVILDTFPAARDVPQTTYC